MSIYFKWFYPHNLFYDKISRPLKKCVQCQVKKGGGGHKGGK